MRFVRDKFAKLSRTSYTYLLQRNKKTSIMKFIGRIEQRAAFEEMIQRPKAHLVVIRGRRRIGKSRLAEEVGKSKKFLRFSGIAPETGISAQDQRNSFASQLSIQLGMPQMIFHDWDQIFYFLEQQISGATHPTVIVLDEISWMGYKDPTFLPKLKNAWDLYFQKHPNLLVILCGSVSTWIEKNIITSTAFFGRISRIITLEPFSIAEAAEFLKVAGFKSSSHEIFKILSVFGGIPWYLEHLNPSISADENIKQLCFLRESMLAYEFDKIFYDIFSKRGQIYKRIMEILVRNPCDQMELRNLLKYSHSGSISKYLEELILSGFVSKHYGWNFKTRKYKKQAIYRVRDSYIAFYFRYILPHIHLIEQNKFAAKSMNSIDGWDSIIGLQLENFVISNSDSLCKELNIIQEDIIASGPFYQKASTTKKGCQIDYLIQLRQNELYLIEVKFSLHPIGNEVIKQIEDKISNFDYPKHMIVKPVLVHVSGVEKTVASNDVLYRVIDLNTFCAR